MLSIAQCFADSYGQARKRFLEGAVIAGMAVDSHACPAPGASGTALATDVALDLAPGGAAARLLVLANAGSRAGSGVLAFALNDEDWRARAHAAGVAVLYLHEPWLAVDGPPGGWRQATLQAVLRERAVHAGAVHAGSVHTGAVRCLAIGGEPQDAALRQALAQACPGAAFAQLALAAANPAPRLPQVPLHPDTWKGIAVSRARPVLFQALAELA